MGSESPPSQPSDVFPLWSRILSLVSELLCSLKAQQVAVNHHRWAEA